ncbi:MAG: ABC transporter substrate-binding protein [Oscillospiraceae bacterium]|jgi:peptide/nickel transport system substrate-binding protein|nr:ABC transporter substrate-binding protein [Oscillospiraceae bacterium]
MKKLLAMLCALCLLLSAFALAEEDTIVFGGTEPTYLEPNAPAIGGPEIHAVEQIQEGLVRMSSDGVTVEPLLATDWTISEDGLTYTFNLVPGVVFSDGTPVKGEDWVWSLYRARDTETSEYRFIAEPIDTVEATDDQVIITLKAPNGAFLAELCSFNMVLGCKAYAESMTEEEYIMNPIGTGAYMLKEWNHGNYVLLEKNPNYRNADAVKTQYIKFATVEDDNTRLMQLQSGQIDIMGDIPASLMDVVRTNPDLTLQTFESTQIRYLLLNTTMEPFSDINVRKALVKAINRAEIAEVVYGEFGGATASVLSAAHAKYFNDALECPPYDPEGAKADLAEAGYPDGIEFTLYSSPNEVYQQIAIMLQSQLAPAGFTVNIVTEDGGTIYENAQNLKNQACMFQWSDDYYDPSEVLGWICDYDQSQAWFTGLNDVELDELQAAALIEQDDAKRVEMYKELQQRVYDNYNVIPLFHNSFAYAYTNSVQGLAVDTFSNYYCENIYKAE